MSRSLIAVLALALAGCVNLTEAQCRAGPQEWHSLGEYDALAQGDMPWIEAYAEVCRPYGVAVDEDEYLKGWSYGHAEWKRRNGS